MRVTTMVPDLLNGIQQSEQVLQNALLQLSTGKRVNQPSDDPGAAAQMVQNQASSANVDQYTKNAASVLSETQTADAALSLVVTSLNQAITLGTQGANGTLTSANRLAIAAQVQTVLASVVTQANSSYRGSYLFAGTASSAVPFTVSAGAPSGYAYNGNSGINSVPIGDAQLTQVNVPGDQIFTHTGSDVIGSLTALVTALQTGSSAQISAATTSVTDALNYVGQQRVTYGNISSQLTSQESYLSQETLTLASQQSALIGIDLSTAITNLSQAQLSHSAILAAAAKVLPTTLLDYLK